MKRIVLILILVIFFSCKQKNTSRNLVVIKTQFGNIHLILYSEKAPRTVAAFLSYVDSGFYKNSTFYRVLKAENQPPGSFRSEVIQGGIYQSNYKLANTLSGIVHEPTSETKLSHNDGTISMARTLPGTASSEFFICVGEQPSYDEGGNSSPDKLGYAAFGRVLKGMETVRKIHSQPENGEDFNPPVKIINITRE